MGGNVIRLDNKFIGLELDSEDGSIIALRNNLCNLDLVTVKKIGKDKVPWRLSIESSKQPLEQPQSLSCDRSESLDAVTARLRWETKFGIVLDARVVLPKDEPNILFYIDVTNNGKEAIIDVSYPVIDGIGPLGDSPQDNRLACPFTTGYLLHDPYNLFPKGLGLKKVVYPNGYGGLSMQFMEYYSKGKGGFYLATHDPYWTAKYFNFYKCDGDGHLICSFTHRSWNIHSGNDLMLNYPVVIAALMEGNWYEGVERYREWATCQKWCDKGPLWRRVQEGKAVKWLVEAPFCTFVHDSSDISDSIDKLHNIVDASIFHILVPDWTTKWLGVDPPERPIESNKANIEAIKRNGDHFTTFEFDLFTKNTAARISPANITVPPDEIFSENINLPNRKFPYGCPVTQYMREMHKRWNLHVLVKSGADGRYYDIGESNAPIYCDEVSHSHPKGAGRWMIDAYRDLMIEAKQAMMELKKNYVPQGTEVIHELFVDILDFYFMRASAGPQTDLEGEILLPWELEYKCEKIPLFGYVYHEYGPIAMDGAVAVSPKFGGIFYWIAARVLLWGDLVIVIPVFENDPEKLEFIREIATARTSFAKDYLAYGRMAQPPQMTPIPNIHLDYNRTRDFHGDKHLRKGAFKVPAILTQAWLYKEKIGILFVNLQKKNMKTTVKIDPADYGLNPKETYRYTYITRGVKKTLETGVGVATLQIDLPPRKVVLIEIAK